MNRWKREVLDYLERRADAGDRVARNLLERGRPSSASCEKAPIPSLEHARARRERSEREEREAMAKARLDVWEFNLTTTVSRLYPAGACDCGCGRPFLHTMHGEFDHWIARSQGGPDSRENGWRLHPDCHRDKTDNATERAVWNERRRLYCLRAKIPFTPRKEKYASHA